MGSATRSAWPASSARSAETSEIETVAGTVEAWAAALLDDYAALTAIRSRSAGSSGTVRFNPVTG
jgi:hypothetical protein